MVATERLVARAAVAVAVGLAACAALWAQEVNPQVTDAVTGAEAQAPAASDHEKAMMEAMIKAGTPGKQHQWLASKAGSWTFTGKFWMNPAAPPMEATGTVERAVALGGRVLVETVSSEFMGQTFEGHGMTGYDNVKQQFWGTWNDSMSTGVMVSTGDCDDQGNCTFQSVYTDPLTGESRKNRMASREEGSDKEFFESYDTGPDGKEYKSMEMVYTRKK
jgi:hypothetical protein